MSNFTKYNFFVDTKKYLERVVTINNCYLIKFTLFKLISVVYPEIYTKVTTLPTVENTDQPHFRFTILFTLSKCDWDI